MPTSLLDMTSNPGAAYDIPMGIANPLDQATKAVTLSNMYKQSNLLTNEQTKSNVDTGDMMATRQAIADNTKPDPLTGQPVTDLQGAVKSLSVKSPTAALNLQISMQQRQTELAEKKAELTGKNLANTQSTVNLMHGLAQGINNQDDLDRLRMNAPSLGMDPNKMPTKYDPAEIAQYRNQTLTAGEALQNKMEMLNFQLKSTGQQSEINQRDTQAQGEIVSQYKDDPGTKEYVNLSNTYQSMKSMQGTKEYSQGILDRDLVYNFQNMINPNRSATGSTTEQDEEARSLLQSWGVDAKGIFNGAQLAPSQRQQITEFAENKFKDATQNQQVVYNNYQNRIQQMRAAGRQVDAINSLPEYGATVTGANGEKTWVGVHNAMKSYGGDTITTGPVRTEGATGIQLDGPPPAGIGQVNSSDLQPPGAAGSYGADEGNASVGQGAPPAAPTAQTNEYAKTFTQGEVAKAAKARGVSVEEIKSYLGKSGYKVED